MLYGRFIYWDVRAIGSCSVVAGAGRNWSTVVVETLEVLYVVPVVAPDHLDEVPGGWQGAHRSHGYPILV